MLCEQQAMLCRLFKRFNLWPAKVCIKTCPNFQQLALSKDGNVSADFIYLRNAAYHFIYLRNAAFYDPSFTSAPDAEDSRALL